MRTFIVALAIALVSVPAYAQYGVGGVPESSSNKSGAAAGQAAAKKKERAEAERAAKKAIEGLPDKPYDPWQNVRP